MLPGFIILSVPLRRYNHSVQMKQELLDKGRDIWNVMNDESITGELRVFVIVSADLAHTYTAESKPYGNCSCAEPYDEAIGQGLVPWMSCIHRRKPVTNRKSVQ